MPALPMFSGNDNSGGTMKSMRFLSLLFISIGCGGGLRVDSVATSSDKPSNVAVYLTVTKDGLPVKELFEKNFRINEEGQDLTAEQTKQTLLPRDMAAVHKTLLLVDMSGPVTEGDTRERIVTAVGKFVTRAHTTQTVTLYAFDGGAGIRLISDFPQGTAEVTEIPELTSYKPDDASSNLNSAVVEALAQLDARLMTAQKPIRVGTLVVFARGPDLAGRVQEHVMSDALRQSPHLVYSISIKNTPGFYAGNLSKTGSFEAETMSSINSAFESAGTRIADSVNSYYLLSYCSPGRAGQRHFRVNVVMQDEKGQELSGSISSTFDASGFGSGCDPTARPRFVVRAEESKPSAGAPAATPAAGTGEKPAATEPKKAGEDDDKAVPPPSKPGYAQ
jgi:hypothetical protein